jgi:hypothetical protein
MQAEAPLELGQGPPAVGLVIVHEVRRRLLDGDPANLRTDRDPALDVAFTLPE